MEDYGHIIIHLEELIQASGLSKNKVSQRAEMQRTQLNNYCKNEVARVDLAVLARLCHVLGVGIDELLEYRPARRRIGRRPKYPHIALWAKVFFEIVAAVCAPQGGRNPTPKNKTSARSARPAFACGCFVAY